MADSPNTLSTLNGIAKEVYGDEVKTLVPDGTKVQQLVKFSAKEKQLGNKFHQPVILGFEHGFTFAGPGAGAFSLNDSVATVMQDAQVQGYQMLLKSQIDYETAARASKSKNSFLDATGLMFESMQKSMRKRLEVEFLYGQAGLAAVGSVSSNTVTIGVQDWAAGVWAGMEGALVEVRNAAGNTSRGTATISSINIDNRTITFGTIPVGTIATDIIWYYGAYGNEMAGIYKVMTNAGSLFNIDASVYNLWKSATYAVSGTATLSFAHIGAGVSRAVARGLSDDVTLLVNNDTWNNVLTDQAALVKQTPKDMKIEVNNGGQSIKFFSQNGSIEIVPSIYVKGGMAFGINPDQWKRLGAADVTFKTPGYGDDIFTQLSTKAGFEVRAYTNQAIFCESPATQFLISNITNT